MEAGRKALLKRLKAAVNEGDKGLRAVAPETQKIVATDMSGEAGIRELCMPVFGKDPGTFA
ncbi:hypothetical protein AA3271_1857 [Gluconobacter japonicus NBRC 3271]|nr:hypothetical protein AA3271_1857 [Gluconobacter japonicus NBRC 3271]